jgi:hypothetical protein
MIRFGAGLEKRQAVLGRLVDIGAELFVMTSACVHARKLQSTAEGDDSAVELADLFCRQARRRIRSHFAGVFRNDDAAGYAAARKLLDGRYSWLEEGVLHLEQLKSTAADESIPASPPLPTP